MAPVGLFRRQQSVRASPRGRGDSSVLRPTPQSVASSAPPPRAPAPRRRALQRSRVFPAIARSALPSPEHRTRCTSGQWPNVQPGTPSPPPNSPHLALRGSPGRVRSRSTCGSRAAWITGYPILHTAVLARRVRPAACFHTELAGSDRAGAPILRQVPYRFLPKAPIPENALAIENVFAMFSQWRDVSERPCRFVRGSRLHRAGPSARRG